MEFALAKKKKSPHCKFAFDIRLLESFCCFEISNIDVGFVVQFSIRKMDRMKHLADGHYIILTLCVCLQRPFSFPAPIQIS